MHRTILFLASALLASSTKISRDRVIPDFIPNRSNDEADEAMPMPEPEPMPMPEPEIEPVIDEEDEIVEGIDEECACPAQP